MCVSTLLQPIHFFRSFSKPNDLFGLVWFRKSSSSPVEDRRWSLGRLAGRQDFFVRVVMMTCFLIDDGFHGIILLQNSQKARDSKRKTIRTYRRCVFSFRDSKTQAREPNPLQNPTGQGRTTTHGVFCRPLMFETITRKQVSERAARGCPEEC